MTKYSLNPNFLYSLNEEKEVVLVNIADDSSNFLILEGQIADIFIDLLENNRSIEELSVSYDSEGIKTFINKLCELGVIEEATT